MTGDTIAARAAWTGLGAVRHTLANGVTLIVKSSRTTPAVTLHASLRVGSVLDPPGLEGLAQFHSRVVDRGTVTRSSEQIADALDGRGAALAVTANRHMLSLVCTCLVEDLAPVMAVLADVVRHPTFPEHEVETRRGEILTLLQQDADSPATVALEAVLEALYGATHPYGRRARGTSATVARIDRDALAGFHAEWVGPAALTLVIVGDVDVDQAVEQASRVFGDWTGGSRVAPALPPREPAATRTVRVVPMMNKSQADIAYGFVTIARADPRYPAYYVLNTILAQYALGGRLGESIRERQGMAYYVFSAFEPSVIPSPLIIRAGVSAANVERALGSIDAELAAFIDAGPTDKEMTESRQYLVGALPRQLETNAAIARFLAANAFFGLPIDYERRVPDLLSAVTADAVRDAARVSLAPERATVVVAGPYAGSPA